MGCWQGLLEVGWYHGLLAGTIRDGYHGLLPGLLEVGWYHGLLAGTVRGGMVPWAAGRDH